MDIDALIQIDKSLLLLLNGSHSLFADGLALTLTNAKTWIPLYVALFYVVLKNNENVRQVLLIVGCVGLCVLLTGCVDDVLVKPYVERLRPGRDAEIGLLVDTVNNYRGGKYGFFSAHAANTFSVAVFLSLLFRNRSVSLSLLVLWSLVNCWTRLYLGVHFFGDVLSGLLWGLLVGVAVYGLFTRLGRCLVPARRYVSSHYTSTGYQKSDADIIVGVLAFTNVYAVLRACMMLYIN